MSDRIADDLVGRHEPPWGGSTDIVTGYHAASRLASLGNEAYPTRLRACQSHVAFRDDPSAPCSTCLRPGLGGPPLPLLPLVIGVGGRMACREHRPASSVVEAAAS